MSKSVLKKSFYLILTIIVTVFTTACSKEPGTGSSSASNAPASSAQAATPPVKITYATYRVGKQVTAAAETKIINDFKAKYGNEVDLQVEEIPDDQTYIDKMKVLAASNNLPDIVEGKDGINDILIKGNLATPLNEYLDADPQWKSEIGNDAIAANSRDGKVWSISNSAQILGYFYNKDIFAKAGIKPADTWDEFQSNNDKIKALGIAPLALMTGENAWTTNLFLASIVGTSNAAGNKFMNTMLPKNYESPEMINGLKQIQTMLQKYTTKDALGAGYANAANNFLQGKAAIIANGPWMIPDFTDKTKTSDGFDKKVGVAAYPGSGMFSTYEVGYMLTSKDQAHKDAAMKFLKFKTGAYAQEVLLELGSVMPLTNLVKITDDFKQKNPLFAETIDLGLNAKNKYASFDVINYGNITDVWKTLYPELVFNKSTAEQIAKKLSDVAAKNK
jgi:raffinose/stachyose/melibiose transport system substrate-binding protein